MAVTIKDALGVNQDIATELIGGNHYQVVKSGWGVGGVLLETSKSNPMPVQVPAIVEVDSGASPLDAVNDVLTTAVPDGAVQASVMIKDTSVWASGSTVLRFQISQDGGTTWRAVPTVAKNSAGPLTSNNLGSNSFFAIGIRDFKSYVSGA